MRQTDLLANIRVASPCPASWDAMTGDEVTRFCSQCGKHVYSLSGMSRAEAEQLIREKEGRLCIRCYRRRDGTILTDDCPVGLRAARRWLLAQIGGISAAFGLLTLMAPVVRAAGFQRVRHSRLAEMEPFRAFFEWIDPAPRQVFMGSPPVPVSRR